MKKYYIKRNGKEKGPFTMEQIPRSSIEPTDFIWTEGMAGWQQAQTKEEFKKMFSSSLRCVHASFNYSGKIRDSAQVGSKGYIYIIWGTILMLGFCLFGTFLINGIHRSTIKPGLFDYMIAGVLLLVILIGGIRFFRSGLRNIDNSRK